MAERGTGGVPVNDVRLPLRVLAALFRLLRPGLPGKSRLARWLLRDRLPHGMHRIRLPGGRRFKVPSLHEPVAFHLLIDGLYEPLTTAFLERQLQPGMVFVDVGANIGVHTLSAARRVGAGGTVVAFEPSPDVFACLAENVAASGCPGIIVRQVAICERSQPVVPFYPAPADHFGMGGLAPQFSASAVPVAASPLDQALAALGVDHVDLVKVDVEGFEAEVFRGGAALLGRPDAPAVLFEFCDWAEARACDGRVGVAQAVLLGYGYRVWSLRDWLGGGPPLGAALTAGASELIAFKDHAGPGVEPGAHA